MMAWRMPILREHDMRKAARNIVDDGNDRVAIGHRQRAAWQGVVLDIDDEKNVAIREHVGPRACGLIGQFGRCAAPRGGAFAPWGGPAARTASVHVYYSGLFGSAF